MISAPSSLQRWMAASTCERTLGFMPSTKYSFGTPSFTPFKSPPSFAVKSSAGRSSEVESWESLPVMTFKSEAQSRVVRAIGPIWSSEDAKATSP